jgi:hypothetical protein
LPHINLLKFSSLWLFIAHRWVLQKNQPSIKQSVDFKKKNLFIHISKVEIGMPLQSCYFALIYSHFNAHAVDDLNGTCALLHSTLLRLGFSLICGKHGFCRKHSQCTPRVQLRSPLTSGMPLRPNAVAPPRTQESPYIC